MTRDIHVLQLWIRVVVLIAAVCTTSLPIIYSFSPWHSRRLGQLFMLQAVSLAATMDLTALFSVWYPKDILVVFWVDAFVLTAIAVSTASLSIFMWRLNHPKKEENRDGT